MGTQCGKRNGERNASILREPRRRASELQTGPPVASSIQLFGKTPCATPRNYALSRIAKNGPLPKFVFLRVSFLLFFEGRILKPAQFARALYPSGKISEMRFPSGVVFCCIYRDSKKWPIFQNSLFPRALFSSAFKEILKKWPIFQNSFFLQGLLSAVFKEILKNGPSFRIHFFFGRCFMLYLKGF